MKVGVISDSHDRLPTLRRAMSMCSQMSVDAVIHAGDVIAPFAAKLLAPPEFSPQIPVHVVYGNNDGERAGLAKVLPQIVEGPLHLEIDQCKIVVHHFIDWLKPQDTAEADVIITGHTHEIVNNQRNRQLILNPGECCGWVSGRCTFAVLDTQMRQAQIVNIDES